MYKIHATDKDFTTAVSICESEGANLADLETADDATIISSLWQENAGPSYSRRTFFIGYHKESIKAEFKSVIDGKY